jgi:hypothetical protein
MDGRVYRCRDGHYFRASWARLLFASVHFGASHYLRCPVDHRWRMADPVAAANLTPEQSAQAAQYQF